MSSQIFRKPFPKEKLVAFLDRCTENKNNSYVFSKTAFKSAQYKDIVVAFCKEIEGYYYDSKKYYATVTSKKNAQQNAAYKLLKILKL